MPLACGSSASTAACKRFSLSLACSIAAGTTGVVLVARSVAELTTTNCASVLLFASATSASKRTLKMPVGDFAASVISFNSVNSSFLAATTSLELVSPFAFCASIKFCKTVTLAIFCTTAMSLRLMLPDSIFWAARNLCNATSLSALSCAVITVVGVSLKTAFSAALIKLAAFSTSAAALATSLGLASLALGKDLMPQLSFFLGAVRTKPSAVR